MAKAPSVDGEIAVIVALREYRILVSWARMSPDAPTPIDVFGLDLVDLRATVESMNRCVQKSQANFSQFRYTRERSAIDAVTGCLDQLAKEADVVIKSVARTRQSLAAAVESY